jgi:hypothetical protein
LIIRDDKYWLPLLGLYHGNRLEEFAQLHRSDVRCEDGIWYMDINDDDQKQLKNDQSKRRVPVHPFVLELGFLEYVKNTAREPKARIFPQLRPGGPDKKLGFFFTKWWTQYRKDIGVYQKKLDYHSFRGGVTTKLSAAKIPLDVRNELLGHEGQSIDQQNYLKGLPLRILADAIACIEWPEVKSAELTSRRSLKASSRPAVPTELSDVELRDAIREDPDTGTPLMWIVTDQKIGRRVKTESASFRYTQSRASCAFWILSLVADTKVTRRGYFPLSLQIGFGVPRAWRGSGVIRGS